MLGGRAIELDGYQRHAFNHFLDYNLEVTVEALACIALPSQSQNYHF